MRCLFQKVLSNDKIGRNSDQKFIDVFSPHSEGPHMVDLF